MGKTRIKYSNLLMEMIEWYDSQFEVEDNLKSSYERVTNKQSDV